MCMIVTRFLLINRQLNVLVHERHDAFARLKTAEDLLEAVRAENEMLHRNVALTQVTDGGRPAGSKTWC